MGGSLTSHSIIGNLARKSIEKTSYLGPEMQIEPWLNHLPFEKPWELLHSVIGNLARTY